MGSCALVMSLPDEDLVRRCRNGEDEAFLQLYQRYRRQVLSTTYRIIRNTEEAQEATQDIFMKFHRSMAEWNPEKSKLSTWLYRMACNHAIDRWRVQRKRIQRETTVDPGNIFQARHYRADARTGPYNILERKEIAREILCCARRLPRLQKRLFILRHLYGFRLEEIARMEGRSLGTIKGLLFRASRTIRRKLTWRLQYNAALDQARRCTS